MFLWLLIKHKHNCVGNVCPYEMDGRVVKAVQAGFAEADISKWAFRWLLGGFAP